MSEEKEISRPVSELEPEPKSEPESEPKEMVWKKNCWVEK